MPRQMIGGEAGQSDGKRGGRPRVSADIRGEPARRNLATDIRAVVGDVERALQESDRVYERTYRVHQVQQASIEPHIRRMPRKLSEIATRLPCLLLWA